MTLPTAAPPSAVQGSVRYPELQEENMKTLAIITALLLAATALVATTGDASANKKGSHYRCYSGC